MPNKVKVPGGAFYAGDGLTVDPITRTVSAGGGGGDSGVTTLHIYVSAIDKETLTATFTADKTPKEIDMTTPMWCVLTFAAGVLGENEMVVGLSSSCKFNVIAFGYVYIPSDSRSHFTVSQKTQDEWELDIVTLEHGE